MPHGRNGQLGTALIGRNRFVGHEVKDAAAVGETSLLDLVLAHMLLDEEGTRRAYSGGGARA